MLLERTKWAFVDELVKIAAVRGPVKMYRRALKALTSGDKASHGIKDFEKTKAILQTGHLKPNLDFGAGTHGPAVYLWNQTGPKESYINHADSHGLIMPHPKPGTYKSPVDPNPRLGRVADMTRWQHLSDSSTNPTMPMSITRPPPANATSEQLRQSRTSLVAPASDLRAARRLQADPSNPLPGGTLQHHRLKPIDSAIFNRAEADLKANRIMKKDNYGGWAKRPSKKELLDLHKRRTSPPKFQVLRGDTEDAHIRFAETYQNLVGKK